MRQQTSIPRTRLLSASHRETKSRSATPTGSIRVRANLSQMIRPGDVHMYHGYPDADANRLLEGDYLDPISGFPGYKAALCAVCKASAYPDARDASG